MTKVTFGERAIDVVLRDGRTMQTIAPPGFLAGNSPFFTDLAKRQVRVEGEPVADPRALSYGMIVTIATFFIRSRSAWPENPRRPAGAAAAR